MDSHKNAPFVTKIVKLAISDFTGGQYVLPDILSYWTISDCFDESGNNNGNSYIEWANKIPFGQVFGLINYQGVRKATFSAYNMLHMMGTTNLSLTGGSGESDGVDAFATVNKDSTEVSVLIYNYYANLKGSGVNDTAKLQLSELPFPTGQNFSIQHYRIDSTHTNPYQVWVNQELFSKPTKAPLSVSVYSANGQLLRSFTSYEQSVNIGTGLPNGMYLILIQAPEIKVS